LDSAYIVVNPHSKDRYVINLEDSAILSIGRREGTSQTYEKRLVLPNPEISSQHAEIRKGINNWTIRDLGSLNGTKLNGERLASGRDYPLKNGDLLTVGLVEIKVHLPSEGDDDQDEELARTQLHIQLITATILVADIRGFTTLTELYKKQPAMLMQITQSVFELLSQDIADSNGKLEKIAGDAIMAYWIQEDGNFSEHAYQACLAACNLKDRIRAIAQNPVLWPFPDFDLHIDIALCTGPVAAGSIARFESGMAIMGDTANIAFRLEKLIGEDFPGEVIMDEITYELVKDKFTCKYLGEFAIKGRQDPVKAYQLKY
jgi:class 3 adenylate cyclase